MSSYNGYCYPQQQQYDQLSMDLPPQYEQEYQPSSYPTSLKRKSPMYTNDQPHYAFPTATPTSDQNTAAMAPGPMDTSPRTTNCDVCKYPDPILYVPECGHTFHSRCVGEWPMVNCPYCQGPVQKVAVVQIDMNTKTTPRSGKWTKQEEKFVNMIVDEFDQGSFPLANGTPVRLVLAKLLNCSPMRLSKKFQKNALGKRTYRVPKSGTSGNGSRICFDSASHQARQIEFSATESAFRQEVVLLQRKDNKQDGYLELRDLRLAVIQFWVSNFLKFALCVGQQVEGLDTTEPKKKKQAMQKLREGMFDQLLTWGEKRPPSPPQPQPQPQTQQIHQSMPQWDMTYLKPEGHYKPYDDSENQNDREIKGGEIPFQSSSVEYKHQPHQHQASQQLHGYRENNMAESNYNFGQQYKRPATMRDPSAGAVGRMALTPLPMRAGGASMRPHVENHSGYDNTDQTTNAEIDGLLMGGITPSSGQYRQIPAQHPQPTSYDPMEPIAQLPQNTSWDQMLDEFTGISSHLVDPTMNSWSNIQLS